jgi:hypothetical protein
VNRIVHTLLIALALGVAGCNSGLSGAALIQEPGGGDVVLISDSPGGNIDAFDQAFADWSRIPGVKVEIRHWCASACTQVLNHFEPEQICLSPGARLGFHSAIKQHPSSPAEFDSLSTLIMFAGYPDWLQRRLFATGIMGYGAGNPSAILGAEEFWYHGYGVCPHPIYTAGG